MRSYLLKEKKRKGKKAKWRDEKTLRLMATEDSKGVISITVKKIHRVNKTEYKAVVLCLATDLFIMTCLQVSN